MPPQPRIHATVVAFTIALMAVLLIGGSVVAVELGRTIPKWMEDADILIIAAAFGASGFFAQTVQVDRQADTLSHLIERNHELAMASASAGAMTMRTTSGQAGHVAEDSS